MKYFDKNVLGLSQMGMQYMVLGSVDDLKWQIVELIFECVCLIELLLMMLEVFKSCCVESKVWFGLVMQEVCWMVGMVFIEWQVVIKKLFVFKVYVVVVLDIEVQLKWLMGKCFVFDMLIECLQYYLCYLKGIQVCFDKLKVDLVCDV